MKGGGACAPVGTFQVGHFKEDKKFRPMYGHTALDIRPPEVFCDVENAPDSYSAGAPPHTHAVELPTLSSRLGPPARWGGRTNICPGRRRPSRRHWLKNFPS